MSTRENVQKWHTDGIQIMDIVVKILEDIVRKIREITENDIETLKNLADTIRVKANEERC